MSKKNGKKSLWAQFKEFAFKGNVIDMAVGVVIGGAFTAIVGSLVADIITPLLGLLTGGVDFKSLYIPLDGGVGPQEMPLAEAKELGRAIMTYGNFIQAIINFILIAVVIFIFVKIITAKAKKEAAAKAEAEAKAAEEAAAAAKAQLKVCPYCLSEINIKATRCPHCTSEQP